MKSTMEAHLQLLGLPTPPHFTKSSPWNSPTSIHPTTALHQLPISAKRTTNELRAQGRGFGAPVTNKKPVPKQDDSPGEEDNGADEIPQEVFDRMIRRVILSVLTPMASGIGLLYVESFLKEHGIWDVPRWLPFLTILLGFGTSALGIAYGTLSASWDPEREGSLFGWEEAQKNWPELWKEDDKDNKR